MVDLEGFFEPLQTPFALHGAVMAALEGRWALDCVPGLELAPGAWVEWRPGAPARALSGRFHIGARTAIHPGARVSDSVIGAGASVGRGTVLKRAAVLPGVAVGPDLTCEDVILGPDFVMEPATGVMLPVFDRFVLAPAA